MTTVESKKFKVGDRVISVKNTPNVQEGFIGHIVEVRPDPWSYLVDSGKGSKEGFSEEELELLSVGKSAIRLGGVVHNVEVIGTLAEEPKPDAVNHPKHYAVFEQLEAIEVIASSMTTEQFYGYCLGNILKYRLRAGGKDDVMQELGKADKYQELFTQFKSLCKDAA